MRWLRRNWPPLVGCILGAAVSLFVLVYLPMKGNYDECGRVTLCPNEGGRP